MQPGRVMHGCRSELLPIVLASQAWGESWRGCQVVCHCDNQAVVADLKSKSSRHREMMHLLRCVVFVEAIFGCIVSLVYINTKSNHLADDLSRNNVVSFLSKVQLAQVHPTQISLLELLLDQEADWTAQAWRQRFSHTTFTLA